jgi:hypothetical protein
MSEVCHIPCPLKRRKPTWTLEKTDRRLEKLVEKPPPGMKLPEKWSLKAVALPAKAP